MLLMKDDDMLPSPLSCTVYLKELQYLGERYYGKVANRWTCHGGRLHLPRLRLEVGQRDFYYFGKAYIGP